MNTTFIYALCDPDTGMVRYVGKSDIPKTRYFHHLRDEHKTHKVNWIKQLKSQGKAPVLKIIEEIDKNLWEQSEKKWVDYYRSIVGDKLTNITDGGIGPNMTEETRKKISRSLKGRIPSEATLKGSVAYRKGKPLSLEIREKISRAFTPDMRKKMSDLRKGKTFGPEFGKKISEANKGRKSPLRGQKRSIETRLKISEATKKYFSFSENRKKQSENTKNYFLNHPEAKKKKSDSCKNQWTDPIKRKKILEARKNLNLSSSHRQNISASLKNFYSLNPEKRLQLSENAKRQWAQKKLSRETRT